MVRIRLRRAGGKGQPTHRIVAADRESPRDGRFIEILGDYNPRTEPATIRVKEDRIYHWLSVGAQPSDSVLQIFRTIGLSDRYQRFKDGEDIEVLVAEGKQIESDRNQDTRTRRDDLIAARTPKKKEEPVEEKPEETQEEAPVEEPAAEEEVVEEIPVEEPAAEEEVVEEAPAEEPAAEEEVVEEAPVEEPAAEEDVVEETPVEEPAAEEEVVEETPAEEPVAEEETEPEPEPEAEPAAEVKITDAARKIAEEAGIDISTVEGTGKDGAILKSDITKLIKD